MEMRGSVVVMGGEGGGTGWQSVVSTFVLGLGAVPSGPGPAACVATAQTRRSDSLLGNDPGDTFSPTTTTPTMLRQATDILLTADRAADWSRPGLITKLNLVLHPLTTHNRHTVSV